jgi:hypothetical protein
MNRRVFWLMESKANSSDKRSLVIDALVRIIDQTLTVTILILLA